MSITVSTGNVVVPDVSGLEEAQARSDLVQAGFEVQVIYQETPDTFPGQVLAQSPTAGSPITRGSVITITVAKAPPLPSIPPEPTIEPNPVASEQPVPVASDGPPIPQP